MIDEAEEARAELWRQLHTQRKPIVLQGNPDRAKQLYANWEPWYALKEDGWSPPELFPEEEIDESRRNAREIRRAYDGGGISQT